MSALQDYINSKKKLGTTTGAGIGTTAAVYQQNKKIQSSKPKASTPNWQDNAYGVSQDWLDADSYHEDQARTQPLTPVAPPPAPAEQTTPVTSTKTTTSQMPITKQWAQVLGKTPEEKATEEAQLKKAAQKKEAWGHFFDGLRYLGQAAGVAQGARVAPMSDTGSYFADQYKQEKADRDALDTSSAAYRIKLYELQKQAEAQQLQKARQDWQDKLTQETHDQNTALHNKQMEYYGARTDKTKSDQENNEKKTEYAVKKPYDKKGSSSSGSKSKTKKGSVTEQLAAYAKAHGEKINWKTLKNPANKLQELKEKYESKGKTGSNAATKPQDPNLLKP